MKKFLLHATTDISSEIQTIVLDLFKCDNKNKIRDAKTIPKADGKYGE